MKGNWQLRTRGTMKRGMSGVQDLAFAYCGEGLVRHLDDEMHVVRQRAEGMDPMTEALGPFLEQKVEPVPVGIVSPRAET